MDSKDRIGSDQEQAIISAILANNYTIQTSTPGIVTAVDLVRQTVSVQPTIQAAVSDKDGVVKNVTLPLLVDVLIGFYRGGGFAVTLPLKVGDEVNVIFSSRCIDGWWQTGGISPQLDARTHDLSDGVAFPQISSLPKALAGVSSQNLQIRTLDGSTFIEITPSGTVKVNATGNVELVAESVIVQATSTVITSQDITMNGNVAINGSLTTTGGNVSMNGNISHSGGALESNGVVLDTHTHSGVQQGGSNTGGPN